MIIVYYNRLSLSPFPLLEKVEQKLERNYRKSGAKIREKL
jgi:hypothetical protein